MYSSNRFQTFQTILNLHMHKYDNNPVFARALAIFMHHFSTKIKFFNMRAVEVVSCIQLLQYHVSLIERTHSHTHSHTHSNIDVDIDAHPHTDTNIDVDIHMESESVPVSRSSPTTVEECSTHTHTHSRTSPSARTYTQTRSMVRGLYTMISALYAELGKLEIY